MNPLSFKEKEEEEVRRALLARFKLYQADKLVRFTSLIHIVRFISLVLYFGIFIGS